jgi:FkbM family methyltransferase
VVNGRNGAGVLTMAFGPSQYIRMAKGLARSIRLHDPRARLAIVTDREPASLRRWFDVVVPMNPEFGPGLAQKLHLDRYTPFERTLFLDSDFLCYRDVAEFWEQFRGTTGFRLFGDHLAPGAEHYALHDTTRFLAGLGLSRMVVSNTGIMFFDRSEVTREVFNLARGIADRGEELGIRRHPVGFFNDEPIFGAVVELLGLPFIPPTDQPIFTLGFFAVEAMRDVNVRRGQSRFVLSGRSLEPAAVHFNVDSQRSEVYDRELRRLEFGRWLGRTPLPDAVTAVRWSPQRLRHGLGRVLATPAVADLLPYPLYRRVARPTPGRLVSRIARRARPPFTFIQVGSNDGRTGDPLFPTVMSTEVRGMLIEPVPQLHQRLVETYASKEGLTFVQAAVAEEEGTREMYWLPPAPGDPFWSDQLGSFSRSVVLSHKSVIPDIAERIETISVPCRTLSSLVDGHGFHRVDLLHVDAEGADLAILKTIDFDAPWCPRCILYEQKHLGDDDRQRALTLLRDAGYRTVDLWTDVLAVRSRSRRLTARLRRLLPPGRTRPPA